MLQREPLYRGISLHIGINSLDPDAYGGWSGQLFGCLNDARAMWNIATEQGYESMVLFDQQATRENVSRAISYTSEKLLPGDVFFLTYSGHGGQLPDNSGEETDHLDETWCLYDGEFLDDELYDLFLDFPDRSRIIVVSDSCHSGTIVRGFSGFRGMPSAVITTAYEAQKDLYDSLPRLGKEKYNLLATVCLLSGCQDNQYSLDGGTNGLFTETLLKVWKNGKYGGDYWQFNRDILKLMPSDQSPGLMFVGFKNLSFEWSRPFIIR